MGALLAYPALSAPWSPPEDSGELRPASPAGDDDSALDFARDIRPILSENCFFCHGPDAAERQADLRLDLETEALRDLGGYAAVVPGRADESELYLRIADPDDPMPPTGSTRELSAQEIEKLRLWIDQGAAWEEHWAYRAPRRPALPELASSPWVANPVDAFILERLREEGLEPAPQASPSTLIRRLSLDLTGLPPQPSEVEAFLEESLTDPSGAYTRLVDRLLDSPRYGEHRARAWLDAARYGDTHGYHLDNERSIWPYRDWVIDAFNRDLPFDRFTIEQLAGDLLPEPSLDQRIATGFNRCNPTSAEGGMIEEEFLSLYAVDRAVTTATVWLGTTMLCARCHDHKYDPVTQREFYEFYAFFNSLSDAASDGNALLPAPTIAVPSDAQQREQARLERLQSELSERLDGPLPELDAAQVDWERDVRERLASFWQIPRPRAFSSEEGSQLSLLGDGSIVARGDAPAVDTYEILYEVPAGVARTLRLEFLPDPETQTDSLGRAENGNFVLTDFRLDWVPADTPGAFRPVEWSSFRAEYEQPEYPFYQALDDDPMTGWGVDPWTGGPLEAVLTPREPLGDGERAHLLRLRLAFRSPSVEHAARRVRLGLSAAQSSIRLGPWFALGPFPDSDGEHAFANDFGPESGVELDARYPAQSNEVEELVWIQRPEWLDGLIHNLEGELAVTYLTRTIWANSAGPMRIHIGSDDAAKLWLNGEPVFEAAAPRSASLDQDTVRLDLREGENRLLFKVVNYGGDYAFAFRPELDDPRGLPPAVARAAESEPKTEAARERARAVLRDHYRALNSVEWRGWREQRATLVEELAELEAEIPRTLVSEELAEPRPAHVQQRGLYDQLGEEVQPGTPACLPGLDVPEGRRATRLDLARWLVDREHPLTGRVTVNRYWAELFGQGLVSTLEDFGSQGSYPTHPELLDWLTVEFIEQGWSVKELLRVLVSSATYRQDSRIPADLLARDPKNAFYARGARFRLDGERIRDSALHVSGLLVEELGGPSVKPYQPDGLWQEVAYTSSNTAKFARDEGQALFRRSLYTFWKRTSPPPSMQLFDAPTRESSCVQRARTNTPLQSLTLMNDEQFVEAARAFAERVLLEAPASSADPDAERIAFAVHAATARSATLEEVALLRSLLEAQRAEYRAEPQAARALIAVGASQPSTELHPVELGAWTLVMSVLLNLDEFVTKS